MKWVMIFGLAVSLWSCGTNIYKQFDDQNPGELAAVALDEDNPDKAIKILDAALEDDPANYELVSLLASAKAQKAGVDTISLTLSLAENNGSDNTIVSLFNSVPEPTATTISLMEECLTLMESIPSASALAADRFKQSMYYTALMTLRTKSIDLDGDGTLSADELGSLSVEAAAAIIANIVAAESSLNGYSSEDGTQDAASSVSSISSSISGQEGADEAEKLRNYLGS
ncbi:MAG: tetratricopeptide repeat protein [Pseudobacteriovorax sp.]|nr:tetratricopeptide repeat protein [Pseudobacteriovorax sp.]